MSRPVTERFCKSCGLVIDAGKAFELAGSNWHTYCFKCSRCNNQLDTETKLLLQGDELICGNCSYTCYSCNKRIEDLAILTGDQAFCAGCFVCRNCKKRIEDLKYARTNQGVFCMGCHEALLARKTRRLLKEKESREKERERERERERALIDKNKSLPSIPQAEDDGETPLTANTTNNNNSSSTNLLALASNSTSRTTLANGSTEDLNNATITTATTTGAHRTTTSNASTSTAASGTPSLPASVALTNNSETNSPTNRRNHPSSSTISRAAIYVDDNEMGHGGEDGPSGEIPLFLGSPVLGGEVSEMSMGSVLGRREGRSSVELSRGRGKVQSSNQGPNYFPEISLTANDSPKMQQLNSSDIINTTMLTLPERSALRTQSPSPREQRVKRVPVGNRSQSYDSAGGSSPSSAYSNRTESNENVSQGSLNLQHSSTPQLTAPITPREALSSPVSLQSKSSSPSSEEDEVFSTPGVTSNIGGKNTKIRSSITGAIVGAALSHRRSASDGPGSAVNNTPTSLRDGTVGPGSGPGPGPVPSYLSGSAADLGSGRHSFAASRMMPPPINTSMGVELLSDPNSPNSPLVQLSEARQKIAYLESVGPTAKQLEHEIAEKRRTVANLEAKSRVAEHEIRIFKRTSTSSIGASSASGNGGDKQERDPRQMIQDFTKEMAVVKNSLISEIQNLIVSRDELKAEIARLLQESTLLNVKNTQLADMNNELQSQMVAKYSNAPHYPSNQSSHVSMFQQGPAYPTHAHHLSTGSNGNNYVTVLDAPSVHGGPMGANKGHTTRKFWRRPGAAVAKGLKGVFASEVEYDSHGLNGTSNNFTPAVTVLSPPLGASNGPSMNGINSHSSNGLSGADSSSESLEQRTYEEDRAVPLLVTLCIDEVEKRGLYSEGIYRKSGGKSHVDSICDAFASQDMQRIESSLEEGEIAGAAGVLKQYLRKLPIPVITFDAYTDFIKAAGSKDKLNAVVQKLPPAHRDTLSAVMLHLHNVSEHSQRNLMTSKNLAVVFAPTLARDPNGEREMIDMHARNEVTQMMIDHANELFKTNE